MPLRAATLAALAALALLCRVASAENADTQQLAGEDEPHLGLSVLALGGVNFVDSSSGPGLVPEPTLGANLSFQLGRLFFDYTDPFWRRALRVDASYLYTGWTDGTDAVNTSSRYHAITLRATVGYPLNDWVLPYLTAGPTAVVESAVFRVDGSSSGITGVVPGFAYGGGVEVLWAFSRSVSLSLNAGVLALRRGYLDDLSVTLGAGVYF